MTNNKQVHRPVIEYTMTSWCLKYSILFAEVRMIVPGINTRSGS